MLARFNLFAFVLHDPVAHPEFHRVLEDRIDELDWSTGNRLLFFALVNPPRALERRIRRRSYSEFEHNLRWLEHRPVDPASSLDSNDSSVTAGAIARWLGIGDDQLPCIVVTENFALEDFVWYRSCPAHLEQQLTELGALAKFHRDKSARLRLWPELDRCAGSGEHRLTTTLARALTAILDILVVGASPSYVTRRHVRETLAQLTRDVNRAKRSAPSGEDADEAFEELTLKLASSLALLDRDSPDPTQPPPDVIATLEADSYRIWRTGEAVARVLMSPSQRMLLPGNNEGFDFTPAVICLAKVFEREVNLSLVHWARERLGVSLPRFYNTYQPGVTAQITPNIPRGNPIDVNRSSRGKWLPPAAGQSLLACDELVRRGATPPGIRGRWSHLAHLWRSINDHRNKAAHSALIGQPTYQHVRSALNEVATSGYFHHFYRLKQQYRGW